MNGEEKEKRGSCRHMIDFLRAIFLFFPVLSAHEANAESLGSYSSHIFGAVWLHF